MNSWQSGRRELLEELAKLCDKVRANVENGMPQIWKLKLSLIKELCRTSRREQHIGLSRRVSKTPKHEYYSRKAGK